LPDTKAKISEALRGKPRKPFTPEQRAQISETLKGKPRSPETRAKISEAKKGKARSPETRVRISETLKGKPRSPETRAKISEAKKGKPHKPHSPETRVRISEAQQRRWSERRKQQTEQLARGRKTALTLHLTPAERQTLRAWQRATTIPAGLARRGRIILLLADGMTITAITKTVGVSWRFVYKCIQYSSAYYLPRGPTSVHASRCLLYAMALPLIMTWFSWLIVTVALLVIVTVTLPVIWPALMFVFTCMPRPPYVGVMGLMLGVGRRPFRSGSAREVSLARTSDVRRPLGPRPVPAPQEEPHSDNSRVLGPCRVRNIMTNLGQRIGPGKVAYVRRCSCMMPSAARNWLGVEKSPAWFP
jgi:hypothetical protein